ncbi:IS630 family transposase [Cohnella sp. 56]|uniref:IS630 family transposase n=1 Tax=Cohnella sp. 56 TaxID=3113722 RepID=UPI0030E9346D
MPFKSNKKPLALSQTDRESLERISQARSEEYRRVERARMVLQFADGVSVPKIAKALGTTVTKVNRCVDKALEFGPLAALEEEQRPGRPAVFTPEAKSWVISLACQKPKELGYSYEAWTQRLLAQHVRAHAQEQGHPCLTQLSASSVTRMLAAHDLQPHKVKYYLERRDPDFDAKRVEVLFVYQQVELVIENDEIRPLCDVYLSYDEKPGIQAIENTAADLPPVAGEHPTISRDSEYKRHGTVSLLAAIDLVTGHVIGNVEDRHRSCEFVNFLKRLDAHYTPGLRIQIILDNHSSHISKETKRYLETVPDRFEFIHTPKHGSWLNLIESFFAKMTKQVLRHIRVKSKDELKRRIERYLEEVNQNPVPFRWSYGLER